MKKILFALSAIFILVFSSCKKDNENPNNGTTPESTLNYYGLLQSNEVASVVSGSIAYTSGSSRAYFPNGGFYNSNTISEGYIGTAVNVGTVSVNSITLKPQPQPSSGIIYDDTSSTICSSPLQWSVSGGNEISAFTYTYTGVKPIYTGYNTLPDTVKLSQNTVINFTGLTGADEIVVYLMGGSGYVSRVLPGSSTSINFTAADLSGITPSPSSTLWLAFNKADLIDISGKKFKFKTGYQIFKNIVTQ